MPVALVARVELGRYGRRGMERHQPPTSSPHDEDEAAMKGLRLFPCPPTRGRDVELEVVDAR